MYIPFISNGIPNPAFVNHEKNNMRSGNEFTMLYYPELPDGVNRLSVIFTDNSDNTDTVSYDVIVSGELVLKDLNNFPNPMRNETNFVFEIGGGDISGNFKIKIYTVSGRLIKTLENPVNIGLNQISWDGKDDDGELVANGTYLYKLTSEGESKLETKTQKLVILR
ncbi:MAG: T9SS type A sorting domain-containing protein [Ignavibacteria bacterium]|nr:T9SS type A sorting domain-containing protein [Ignavibacteria bacterium]